jgi:hypothetical protein
VGDAEYDELARVLLSDIQALVPLVFPDRRPVSEAHIRFIAATLRRWLVDDDLKKLLAPLRRSAFFTVQNNLQAKSYIDRSNSIRYYLTAGVMADGQPIRHIYESQLSRDEIDWTSFIYEGAARLPLKRFLAQPRIYYRRIWFNTQQVLRFAANKLRGNHLDFDRDGEWAALDAANSFLRYGGPALPTAPEGSEVYLILEPASSEILGGVHLEVIAAAAAFVQMEIDGVQLCTLQTAKSLLGCLRRLFRKRSGFAMVERTA